MNHTKIYGKNVPGIGSSTYKDHEEGVNLECLRNSKILEWMKGRGRESWEGARFWSEWRGEGERAGKVGRDLVTCLDFFKIWWKNAGDFWARECDLIHVLKSRLCLLGDGWIVRGKSGGWENDWESRAVAEGRGSHGLEEGGSSEGWWEVVDLGFSFRSKGKQVKDDPASFGWNTWWRLVPSP